MTSGIRVSVQRVISPNDPFWIVVAFGLKRINGLHGRDELGAALIEVVAAPVHRFAGERHHADGLR